MIDLSKTASFLGIAYITAKEGCTITVWNPDDQRERYPLPVGTHEGSIAGYTDGEWVVADFEIDGITHTLGRPLKNWGALRRLRNDFTITNENGQEISYEE